MEVFPYKWQSLHVYNIYLNDTCSLLCVRLKSVQAMLSYVYFFFTLYLSFTIDLPLNRQQDCMFILERYQLLLNTNAVSRIPSCIILVRRPYECLIVLFLVHKSHQCHLIHVNYFVCNDVVKVVRETLCYLICISMLFLYICHASI